MLEGRVQFLDRPAEDSKLLRPDVTVAREPSRERPAEAGGLALAVEVDVETEPETIPVTIEDEVREGYIEILHRPDRRLVTAIELLSPDNKAGSGRGQYLAERNAILHGPANLVELDFLLRDQRPPMARPPPKGDYYAIVARGDRRPDAEVYAWGVRQRLRNVRIPLLAPDADLTLDLRSLYATSFDRGRYARKVAYAGPLAIGLSAEDRAWAEALAKTAAR